MFRENSQELRSILVHADEGPAAPGEAVQEIEVSSKPGLKWLIVCLGGLLLGALVLTLSIIRLSTSKGPEVVAIIQGVVGCVAASVTLLCSFILMTGLFQVQPNEAVILQWFGAYAGTVRTQGLRHVNPFYGMTKISLRLRTIETKQLKVNDKTGTPVEIGAIVVWHVVETARAKFHVDNFEKFVFIQAEAALRALALLHPYDATPLDECDPMQATAAREEISLRGHAAAVAEELREELQRRIGVAGVEVAEARISHLAYAPEIAHAMLQRQQASAVVAARRRIVEGAVGILQTTVEALEERFGMQAQKTEHLDLNRLVTNLLTVLVSHDHVQPVISTTG